jgi:hypothetical protein
MNVKFVGRVIDMWKGNNPQYPDTRVTFTDVEQKGQVKLNVPPSLVDHVVMDGKYALDVVCTARSSNVMGQILSIVSGKIEPLK